MSSTDGRCLPGHALLDRVAAALNPDVLTQKVLAPIELAMGTFEMDRTCASNRDQFLEIIGEFIQHLHRQGSGTPLQLSTTQARARAVQLLEEHYEGVLASGYVGAYLDATRPEGPGLGAVLVTLAGLIAKELMQQRTTCGLVRLINPADWATQRRLVEQLMFSLGPSLPKHVAERPTESLVSAYRELIELYLRTDGCIGAHWPVT